MTEPLDVRPRAADPLEQHLAEVQLLLSRQRRVEDLVHRQEMQNHELVEDLVHKQHLAELQRLLDRLDTSYIARILETLAEEDRIMAWQQVSERAANRCLNCCRTRCAKARRRALLYQRAQHAQRLQLKNAASPKYGGNRADW
jgi:hypothetical protein